MSDPVDARVLRMMVLEAASEEVDVPDWDALEERLVARLDELLGMSGYLGHC